jgi:hypothetical protein
MNTTRIAAACFALALAAGTARAQPGPGPGAGPGAGQGPGPGAGPGKGRGGPPSFGSSNTRGWSMMTREERDAHRQRMTSVKTLDECNAALADHQKQMEARAKERGKAAPRGPGRDMCEVMKQRGMIS